MQITYRTIGAMLLTGLAILIAVGCTRSADKDRRSPASEMTRETAATPFPTSARPLKPRHASDSKTMFEKLVAEDIGIDFLHQWKPRNKYEAQLLKTGFTGGGVCMGDYDADGFPDVYLTRPQGGGRLYRNLGDFRFEDVTDSARVASPQDWTTGATFVDIDNDGDLDLFVTANDSNNHLFVNQADGTFRDEAALRGINHVGANIKTIFADYDSDGDLDAYIVTNRLEPRTSFKVRYLGKPGSYTVAPEHRELVGVINLPSGEQKFTKAGQFDRLFRNDLIPSGQLKFTDVTEPAGLTGNYHGLDGTWWDYDRDGDADLYIANDFTDPDQLLRNNGDGTFTDVTREAVPNTPWFAMGAAFGDVNNDLRLDLLATDMSGTSHYREKMAMGSMDAVAWFLDTAEPRQYMRNALYLNTGTPRFMEVAHMAGLASSDWTWSVKLADFDNDGLEDVFVTNGFTRDYLNSDFNEQLKKRGAEQDSMAWYDAPELKERNLAFRNLGDLKFANVAEEWGFDEETISFGSACGDLDGDGDLDLIVSNFDGPPMVYRNTSADHRITALTLVGRKGSTSGIGASVEAHTSSGKFLRYHNPSNGYLSSNDPTIHIGVGGAETIERLVVRWPSGTVQTLENLETNSHYTIGEPQADASTESAAAASNASPPAPMFAESDALAKAIHRERPFDDFALQPLLPNRLSQLGPGMATGDVNGDQLPDLFLGGAAGQCGQLFVLDPSGTFHAVPLPALEEHREWEDMGCLLIDVDGDQDLDLFVVSGGVEAGAEGEGLQDRLYLNETADSRVRFRHAPNAVPNLRDSGGPAAAVDFDRDGDLDIFVGGRVVPGSYPISPVSRLLQNEAGKFANITESAAAELAASGMVTSAIWSDYDSDGWVDLIVACEFGPIRVYRNLEGQLSERSQQLGCSELFGWWNSITGCDVDCDGDIDYVVGNLGLNTKYHPSPEKPQYVFYGEFDGAGQSRIVEAKPGSDGLLPVRGRSCSSNAMPHLRAKFDSFHAFASASLADIYTETCLADSLRLQANIAATGVLLNQTDEQGNRRFEYQPFPRLAQAAPSFGIEPIDADGDAHVDLFLAQNFYTPQRETGRMAGGVGMVLLGNGDGSFRTVPPDASGVVIPDDAKSVVSIDVNQDGASDIVVAINDGSTRVLLNQNQSGQSIHVPTSLPIGGRVVLPTADGRKRAVERYAGSGYLSCSSPFATSEEKH